MNSDDAHPDDAHPDARDLTRTEQAVTDWLRENWTAELTLRTWWGRLAESCLGFPTWPSGHFGRGWTRDQTSAAERAFRAAGAIGGPTGLGVLMGGPVVIAHGNDEQRSRLLPPLAKGTEGWCQLFSEPGAGSDLASVSTRAERDGDEWVMTGQKVWTSGAAHCKRGMLVARTDPDQPKHRGLTYFIIDMEQPEVEIRPLKQMNGRAHVNEVFLTEARVSDADRIGGVNDGWAVTVATLAFERAGLSAADGGTGLRPAAGETAGLLDVPIRELFDRRRANREVSDEESGSFAMLRAIAGELGRVGESAIRQDLARLASLERIAAASQQRAAANRKAGRPPGAESSTAKLFWTEGLKHSRDLSMEILGPWGMLEGDGTPRGGRVQQFVLTMPSASIAGGSDEIQRNIIGERTLGLPKDIVVDADVPFRETRRS